MLHYLGGEKMNLDELKEIIAEELNVNIEELELATNFQEDLGADSLDLFQLAMALEEKFDVEIPSEDLNAITTVGEAASYIDKKLG